MKFKLTTISRRTIESPEKQPDKVLKTALTTPSTDKTAPASCTVTPGVGKKPGNETDTIGR